METNKAFEALESIGWGKYNTKLYLICGIAWLNFDAWCTNMTYTLEGIKEEWKISNLYLGVIASSFQVGILLGNITWGYFSDKKGRKTPYRLSSLLAFISSVILAFAVHPFMMILGLFSLGFSMAGEVNLTSTIICEFCPPSKRYVLTLLSLFFSLGAILASVIAFVVELLNESEIFSWRIIVGCLCVLQFGGLIGRMWIDETPVFLFESKKIKEAEETLNNIANHNEKGNFSFENLNCRPADCENLGNEEDREEFSGDVGKMALLRQFWWTTLGLGVSFALSLFSFIGIVFFILQFLSFLPKIEAYTIMIIIQFTSIPGVLLGTRLVQSCLGRRWTTALGFVLTGTFSFLFYLNQNFYYIMIFTSVIYFNLYLGFAGLYTIAPESFPTQIRSTAYGLVCIMGRIGGISAPIVSGSLLSIPNGHFFLMCIYAACIVCSGLLLLSIKETRVVPNEK